MQTADSIPMIGLQSVEEQANLDVHYVPGPPEGRRVDGVLASSWILYA